MMKEEMAGGLDKLQLSNGTLRFKRLLSVSNSPLFCCLPLDSNPMNQE